MEHLIANTGIQFIEKTVRFNPSQPLIMPDHRPLKYSFIDSVDFISGEIIFDIAIPHPNGREYIPYSELKANNSFELKPNGMEEMGPSGIQSIPHDLPTSLYSVYSDGNEAIFTVSSPASLRIRDIDTREVKPALEYLLDKWLPMPFFEVSHGDRTDGYPTGWCRLKIQRVSHPENIEENGLETFRLIWAFDTELADPDSISELRPRFYEDEEESKRFGLSNHIDELLGFMSFNPDDNTAFSDFISEILNQGMEAEDHRYIAYYIYLINFIRLTGGAPEIMLHNKQRTIPVDLVIDIGNSRTCGVLFEEGDFTKAMMLELRDLTSPWITYNNAFDMRLVFRHADFGNDIVLEEELFTWPSMVRVGEEALKLVYRSIEDEGFWQTATSHSSPKRYLWDDTPFEGRWEFLHTPEDPFYLQTEENIYIPKLSDLFDAAGNYIEGVHEENTDGHTHFSRSSLMTFVMIEILNQAVAQINSIKFRTKHGNVDCKRVLRTIILTCPTAMPLNEQIKLRKCAKDAYDAMRKCIVLPEINIIPSIESLKKTDAFDLSGRMWNYDEATCCQLVYLYSELRGRYSGDSEKFFSLKGKPSAKTKGAREITIGSIDIGAGTTDVMVCRYTSGGEDKDKLVPEPLYRDSFYLAGDDILRRIIQNLVIEGEEQGNTDMGNISSALLARMEAITDRELLDLPIVKKSDVYAAKADDIVRANDPETRKALLRAFSSSLLRDFFGKDSAMTSYRERRCRLDFNTQISIPIAQMYLELLRRKRPSRVYGFDEIFHTYRPAQYLLDYFHQHFGFRFESLRWRFQPEAVADVVKSTMEPLLRQLSEILHAYGCDILVLGGRPSTLDAVPELFIKHFSVSPHHLIRLNDYKIGSWFPFADGRGYAYDQKATVAVGGMIGYLAATTGFNGMVLDFSRLIATMHSTARFIGDYNSEHQTVATPLLTPEKSTMTRTVSVFPYFIGCSQYNSPSYQARPLYAVYNNSGKRTLTLNISRSYSENREQITLEDVMDENGNTVPRDAILVRQQSIVDDGRHWLDKGEFELFIK